MTRELIKEALFLLNINGLNPLNNSLKSKIIGVCSLLIMSLFVFEVLIAVISRWNGVESLDSASGAVGGFVIIVKLYASIINRKKLATVLQIIENNFWKLDKYGMKIHSQALHAYKIIRIAMLVTATFFTATIIGYYIKPILSDTRSLPIEMYHVKNINNTFTYTLAYVTQLTICITISTPLLGFDCLFISLIVHIVYEIKILKIGFCELSMDNIQRALDEVNRLIDHHNLILRCIKYMRDIYSMVLLIQFMNSLFIMGICLLNVIADGFPPDLPHLITPVPYLMTYMTTLFFYCYGGTLLTIKSQSVADAAFKSLWWVKTQPELRRKIVLVIQRAQKVEKLTAGGMFDLNLTNFAQLIKNTFSFFTLAQAVLQKIQEK